MHKWCKPFALILFFVSGVATAYYWEDDPTLVNRNLKLAALGNLDLVLEEYENEINIYDFGGLSAGIIEDDSGKSSLYSQSVYGIDNTLEISSATDWMGGTFMIGGIYKYSNLWAIGGSFSGLKLDYKFYSPSEMYDVRYDIRNTCDTAVVALHVLKWIAIGLRGAYRRDMAKTTEYINYFEDDDTTWLINPSVSITSPGGKWSFGFGYAFTDMGHYSLTDNIKALTFPVVYRGKNLTVGINIKHKLIYWSDGYMAEKETFGGLQGIYRIPVYDKSITIGAFIDRHITYKYWSYGNHFLDYGVGIALIDTNLGLIGTQIQQMNYGSRESVLKKQIIFNIGFEFNPIKKIPVRLGYIYHLWDPESQYLYDNTFTMGFGWNCLRKITIDFAYNLRIETMDWYYTLQPTYYHDSQSSIAISGRYTF